MNSVEFGRYESYKDSGLEWLGQIPAGWEVRRNKNIFFEASELSKDGSETLLTVSHITGVTPRSEKSVNMFMAETMQGYKVCKVGDLVINTMWAWMGALGTVRHHGICSPAYGVYRPIKDVPYDPRYFDYLFRTANFVTEMTRSSKGIVSSRLRLYAKDFYQLQTVVPSLREQQAIADYIIRHTATIDRKIDLLGQKIKLYQKLRKAIINEAVYQGLNPDIPRKHSGIEWLGEIPAHWEVKRGKDLFSEKSRKGHPHEPLLAASQKSGVVLKSMLEQRSVEAQKSFEQFKLVNIGDFVISLRSFEGGIEIAYHRGIISPAYTVFSAHANGLSKNFYKHLFKSGLFIKKLQMLITGIREGQAIKFIEVQKTIFPKPPFDEQEEIALYLDKKTSAISAIIKKLKSQIPVLKELRKTLINDVVTGKINVTA
jgi:type I restriction enzyme S subunit